jgi:hypothetical protein
MHPEYLAISVVFSQFIPRDGLVAANHSQPDLGVESMPDSTQDKNRWQ